MCKSWACLRCRLFSAVVLVSGQATQQSVHPTLGIRRKSQAFFYASAFFQSDGVPPPAPARVTQTVRWLIRNIMFKIKKHISPFFLLWLTIVSISICLAILLAAPLGDFLYENNGMSYSASNDGFFEGILSLVFLVGLFMGFGQWIVINTKIKKAYSWILATIIGFSFGIFISFLGFVLLSSVAGKYYKIFGWINMIGTLSGAGIFTGFCQWVSLKRKIAGALNWSLVTGMSFVIGFLPIFLIPFLFSVSSTTDPIVRIISVIVSSVLIALVSGYFSEPLIIYSEIENFAQQEIAT